MSDKKVSYKTKKVSFGATDIILYTIDGETWSTRKEELLEIKQRHESEREFFGSQIKGGVIAKEAMQARRVEMAKKAEARKEIIKAKQIAGRKRQQNTPPPVEINIPGVRNPRKSKPKAVEAKSVPTPKVRASGNNKKKNIAKGKGKKKVA